MRRLKARFGGHVLALTTLIGIAMDWSQALGQGTPDQSGGGTVPVPEPATIGLFVAGLAGMVALDRYRRRK